MKTLDRYVRLLFVAVVVAAASLGQSASNSPIIWRGNNSVDMSVAGLITNGITTPASTITGTTNATELTVNGNAAQTAPLVLLAAGGGANELRMTRAATSVAAPSIVSNGDGLGALSFLGYDTNSYESAAQIVAEVDGTPGNGDMPGRIRLLTSLDGAATPTERMRIDNAGNVTIGLDAGDALIGQASATAATPTYTFSSRSGTGMFSSAANTVELATGAATKLQVTNTGGTIVTATTINTARGATEVGYVTSNSATTSTTTSPTNVTSLALTQGAWLIKANVLHNGSAGNIFIDACISPNSASFTGCINANNRMIFAVASAAGVGGGTLYSYVNVAAAATPTYYCVAQIPTITSNVDCRMTAERIY